MTGRPFIDFKTAITDAEHFFGRTEIRDRIKASPFEVRIILGGSRLGKTSFLNAIHFDLLNNEKRSLTAFPVFFDFQYQTLPKSRDNFFYLLIKCLEDSIKELKAGKGSLVGGFSESWNGLISQISGGKISFAGFELDVVNPNSHEELDQEAFRQRLLSLIQLLRREKFEGICFLFDNAEKTVGQAWADETWGYFRSLKDWDDAIRPYLGLILSGYRDLKNYRQKVGSPFQNIGNPPYWLEPLNFPETNALIKQRCQVEGLKYQKDNFPEQIYQLSGGHPYLVQRLLNVVLSNCRSHQFENFSALVSYVSSQELNDYFSNIWYPNSRPYSFSIREQKIYSILNRVEKIDLVSIQRELNCSKRDIKESLAILCGMGVMIHKGNKVYEVGSQLFREWVKQELE